MSKLAHDHGYSLIEVLVVMAMLGAVVGGIVSLFAAGITADADQNRRFQAQQNARVALDKLHREADNACTIGTPSTYNTAVSSVTLYFPSDNCAAGTHSVTWCTVASGAEWNLDRVVGQTCSGSLQVYASYLTKAAVFTYEPPNSHLAANGLGGGTASTYITTQDGSSALPRLYLDIPVNLKPSNTKDTFELTDAIAFRNGPRACSTGVATC